MENSVKFDDKFITIILNQLSFSLWDRKWIDK